MRSHPMEGSEYRPVAVSPLHDDDVNSVVGSVNNDAEMVMTRRDENDEKIRCKAAAIRSLLLPPLESSGTVDLWELRDMAITEYGLVDDSLRKMAWPKLLGIDPSNITSPRPQWPGKYATSVRDNKPYAHDYLLTTSPATTIHSPTIVATNLPTSPISVTTSVTPHSADAEQIERDVSRVTWHLLTGSQRSRNFQMQNKHRKRVNGLLRKKQRRLGDYLNLALTMSYYDDGCNNGDSHKDKEQTLDNDDYDGEEDRLRYYQGFHDVGSIVLSALGGVTNSGIIGGSDGISRSNDNDAALQSIYATTSVMGLTLACQVLTRLARSHFRDAMRPNFHNLQSALKLIVMPLIASFDSELHSHLFDCEMEPYFCLSWVITWFAHDIRDTELVKRLYDFFLVSHPLMSVYVSVAMIIHPLNRIEVLGADCDFACVHHALSDLPKNSSNVGWKYVPGANGGGNGNAGYITGDDDDVSYDRSLQDDQSIDGDGSVLAMDGTTSLTRSSGSCTARVPFQELIDLSIQLMHKIPPRNLINLAKRYHTEITLQPLLAQSSSIALLQPPPSWALASTAESDWMLRQRMRNEMTTKKLNRHQRRNRSKVLPGGSSGTVSTTSAHSPLTIVKSSTRNAGVFRPLLQKVGPSTIHARIASGMGPDGLAKARKMRNNRRMMARVLAIAIISIIIALAKKFYYSCGQQLPSPSFLLSRDHSQDQQSTVDVIIEDIVLNDGLLIGKEEALVVEDVRTDNILQGECDSEVESDISTKSTDELKVNLLDDENELDVCVNHKTAPGEEGVDLTTSDSSVATLLMSSALFIKKVDLHIQKLLKHSLLLYLSQMTGHAGWSKIVPALMKGRKLIKISWLKISHAIEREIESELLGESIQWSKRSKETWRKRRLISEHMLVDTIKKIGKFGDRRGSPK